MAINWVQLLKHLFMSLIHTRMTYGFMFLDLRLKCQARDQLEDLAKILHTRFMAEVSV